ncbi:hypothetical protein AFV7_gp07 [Betalipothrixvirus pezzuloense]|uniref:Uncharacterized protein n=1 Tax=Betalipothrixvirus pezzuloense TaxID=346883 RepID=A7WKM6_9VIRU|nr:hypothetical protein AFV7_gp07 [Acidianus filamentous virus 7]CAJ31626.1 conserved hypothetical protein [Acidianus filamentous virus 7]
MVEKSKIKEELKEDEETDEMPEETQVQKVELQEEAKSEEFVLPFQRENLNKYVWKLLIVKKVEIRDVIFNKTNQAGQVSYIDGYVITDDQLIEKITNVIQDQQTLPIELVKEINSKKKEVYLFSTSQGVYYSLLRSVVPKLKQGAVIVGIAYQQSDYPQPMLVLVHPSQLLSLKKQYEALK